MGSRMGTGSFFDHYLSRLTQHTNLYMPETVNDSNKQKMCLNPFYGANSFDVSVPERLLPHNAGQGGGLDGN